MGKVILDMSMSLDGFIAGPHGEDGGLYNWYFAPDDPATAGNRMVIEESIQAFAAIVMGRRAYEVGERSGGFEDDPYSAAHFVLSHDVPAQKAKGADDFIFVTDGIESALEQAKAAAGSRDVAIGSGADIAQQYLKASLIDEIQIHLVPVLLGEGTRLFEYLGTELIDMEITRVIASPNVTHLKYRVGK